MEHKLVTTIFVLSLKQKQMGTINKIRKIAKEQVRKEIYAEYEKSGMHSAIDYADAEKRGYLKLDLLNVHVYNQVRDERHLIDLMREPDWKMLTDYNKMKGLIHLQNHYRNIKAMPEPIDSIPRLAMFLALIRPSKKHLIGKPWKEVAKTVWDKGTDGYTFKRSHAVAYAHLVAVHMNLLTKPASQA